jgi:hypothetical protein
MKIERCHLQQSGNSEGISEHRLPIPTVLVSVPQEKRQRRLTL